MTVTFDYEATKQLDFDYEALIKRVISACIDYEECPYETDISILLTDDEEIQLINKEYRDIDASTDVLSFPNIEYVTPGDFSNLEDATDDYFHPETGELILGDIVVSIDKAYLQASEYGHTIERELAFLITHSMFHLFGYDHMKEDERFVMEGKQEEVLIGLQILR